MSTELIPITLFLVIGWISTATVTNVRRAKVARAVAELHAQVLNKCSSSQDLIMYLESPSGRQFMQAATIDTANPFQRILSAYQAGIITLLVGIAALLVRRAGFEPDPDRFFLIMGALAIAVGTGFLISAASSYVLCKNWGLLKAAEPNRA